MDKTSICEAMYASTDGVVVRRHKSWVVPAILLMAGVAVLLLNSIYGGGLSNNFSSALVFIGGCLFLVGAILILSVTFGAGVPYHIGHHCYLIYDEHFYDRNFRDLVVNSVENQNVAALLDARTSQVPAIAVAIYHTPDNSFVAMQAFEYSDLEYRPLTRLKIANAEKA